MEVGILRLRGARPSHLREEWVDLTTRGVLVGFSLDSIGPMLAL